MAFGKHGIVCLMIPAASISTLGDQPRGTRVLATTGDRAVGEGVTGPSRGEQ